MIRVAFHAINGVGLGHLVRALCLAKEVRAQVKGAEVLVLTNARDVSMLEREEIDFVRVPPRLAEPHADPDRVDTALAELEEEAVLLAALEAFEPDVVVFDTHAPMRIVRQVPVLGARAVLVLRELRDDALRSFVRSGAALAFDRIVIPHEHGDMDLGPLADAGVAVEIVGPVVRAIPRAKTTSTKPRVVAVAGGGGQPVDARRYVRAVADAHLLARARVPDLETTIVTGPYGTPPAGSEEIPGLTVLRSPPDLGALLAKAALVVSQSGYNAVAELRALEKPAVLVPAYRKAEDQRARALRLQRVGAALIAKPEARSIADRLEAILTTANKLEAMREAHRHAPLVPKNDAAALAAIAPAWKPARPIRKVVLVAHDFAPKLGGMETVARALAKSLLARGIDVRVYTTSRLGADSPLATGLPTGVVVPIYRPRPPPQRIDLAADLFATIDAALRDDPDVVHLCHAGLGPWIPALRRALPAVVTANVHGNDLLAPWVSHGTTDDAYRDAQIAGLSQADAVLGVSRFAAGLARAQGIAKARIHTIENGVDAERFRPAAPNEAFDETLAARLGIRSGDEVLLTVSRLAPRKGHATVLRAVARLANARPRLRYVFTGASESMIAELTAVARELGIASRIVAAASASKSTCSSPCGAPTSWSSRAEAPWRRSAGPPHRSSVTSIDSGRRANSSRNVAPAASNAVPLPRVAAMLAEPSSSTTRRSGPSPTTVTGFACASTAAVHAISSNRSRGPDCRRGRRRIDNHAFCHSARCGVNATARGRGGSASHTISGIASNHHNACGASNVIGRTTRARRATRSA